jgi:hypothetical protein
MVSFASPPPPSVISQITLMCCVRTSEQRATLVLYSIDTLVLYNRGLECSLRGTS